MVANYWIVLFDEWFRTVDARARPKNKPEEVNKLTFTFQQKSGFIELDYSFSNGVTIHMNQLHRNK